MMTTEQDRGLFHPVIAADEGAQQRVREWIAALRSGKYAQAAARLRTTLGFCCLGVACDLSDPSRWLLDEGCWEYDGDVGELPDDLVLPYALWDTCGRYDAVEDEPASLAALNDSGATFAEIADLIERELTVALATELVQ
jgi:hypothetical protein